MSELDAPINEPINERRQVTVTSDIRQINENSEIERIIYNCQKAADITLLSEQQIIKSYGSIPKYIIKTKKEYDEYIKEKNKNKEIETKNKKIDLS